MKATATPMPHQIVEAMLSAYSMSLSGTLENRRRIDAEAQDFARMVLAGTIKINPDSELSKRLGVLAAARPGWGLVEAELFRCGQLTPPTATR